MKNSGHALLSTLLVLISALQCTDCTVLVQMDRLDAGTAVMDAAKEHENDDQGSVWASQEDMPWEFKKNSTTPTSFAVTHLTPGNVSRILPLCKVLERRVFPKHESLAERLDKEVKRRNAMLVYSMPEGTSDQLAGYMLFSWHAPRRGSIEKVCVAQAYRRKGVGRGLCEAALKLMRSRGVDEVFLHVDPERQAAIALYTNLGFEQHGAMIQNYYCEGRHAMRMMKKME